MGFEWHGAGLASPSIGVPHFPERDTRLLQGVDVSEESQREIEAWGSNQVL